MRTAHGSLVEWIKNAMFTIFGKDKLDYINSQSSIKELKEWKTSSKIEWHI